MGEGDSTVSVFTGAAEAARAASDLVRGMTAEPWPDDIRMRPGGDAHRRGRGRWRSPRAYCESRRPHPCSGEGGRFSLASHRRAFWQPAFPTDSISLTWGLTDRADSITRRTCTRCRRRRCRRCHHLPSARIAASWQFEPETPTCSSAAMKSSTPYWPRLAASRFVAIVGASGSGKSSLVRAGSWRPRGAVRSPRCRAPPSSRPGRIRVGRWKSLNLNEPARLLVVDQLEEAFTLCSDELQRARFFDAAPAQTSEDVVSLRADFYGHCANASQTRHPRVREQRVARAHDPERDSASHRGAGERERTPVRARSGRARCWPTSAGEPGALPLLSHALYETWARRDGRILTLDGYREAGGVHGAIARTAERGLRGRHRGRTGPPASACSFG